MPLLGWPQRSGSALLQMSDIFSISLIIFQPTTIFSESGFEVSVSCACASALLLYSPFAF
jgi:hypothetical protein